jgi:MerR family transcriptional regulator, light-induced transcriptional regulator
MSEDHAAIPGRRVPPLALAQDVLHRRGHALPPSALRVLAREVILRVRPSLVDPVVPNDRVAQSEIDALSDALMSFGELAASDLVRTARHSGMGTDTLYHVYIAGAVRQLGLRWERDEATAAQVILGAGRVYAILRELREVFLYDHLAAPPGAEAVFATVPGEVHGLGVTMAADAMRRKGWDITLRIGMNHDQLVDEIAALRPTIVGLSASLPNHIMAMARLIVALRMRCPQVWILVGGSLVAEDPEVTALVDADAGATNAQEGVALLEAHLVTLTQLRSARA